MPDELESRVAAALHAEVADLPVTVTAPMVEERLAHGPAFAWQPWAFVAASIGVVVLVLMSGSAWLPQGDRSSAADPRPTIVRSNQPIGLIQGQPRVCMVARREVSGELAAWWYTPGGDGCATTNSSLVSIGDGFAPTGDASDSYSLRFLVQLTTGEFDFVEIATTIRFPGGRPPFFVTADGPVGGTLLDEVRVPTAFGFSETPLPTPQRAEPAHADEWGPLAVVSSTGGDEALSTGVLRISDRCAFLEKGSGEVELLVWPADRTAWDVARAAVAFSNPDGTEFSLRDGEVLNVGGGGDSTVESGVSGVDWAESVDWVAAPDPECPMEIRWYVGEIVAAPRDHRVELPTGTFVSTRPFDGTCLALTIVTPDDVSIQTRWWDAGASGDCETRTSDIATTLADFTEPPALRVSIPSTDGDPNAFSLRFTGTYVSGIKFARNGEHEVGFERVDVVAPTFDPVP